MTNEGRDQHPLLCRGPRGRDDAGHDILLAVEQVRDARRDLLLPMVAFIHRLVERLALPLAFEAAHPDINRIVGLAAETAGDHHALGDLEGDDLLFHDLEPFGHLAGPNLVLPQFVEGHIARPPGGLPVPDDSAVLGPLLALATAAALAKTAAPPYLKAA